MLIGPTVNGGGRERDGSYFFSVMVNEVREMDGNGEG